MNVVAVKWKGATEHNTMQHSALHDATQRRLQHVSNSVAA